MPASPIKEGIPPKHPSPAPNTNDRNNINRVIDDIDELMKKQTSSENKRQDALATTIAAQRDSDLAQDLLHTSLQRIAKVDDDNFQARAVLSTKEEALNKVKSKKRGASEKRQIVDNEAAELRKVLQQQSSLVADLQRKLLQQGISPENILKLQEEARNEARHIVASSFSTDFSRQGQKEQPRKSSQARRRMKFPMFRKAS